MRYLLLVIFMLVFLSHSLYAQESKFEQSALYDKVMKLEPNLENGQSLFFSCTSCHHKESSSNKEVSSPIFIPQLAGQHREVIVKQMTDFSLGNRENNYMTLIMKNKHLITTQSIADVTAFIATLTAEANQTGTGNDLRLGKDLYRVHCQKCHGDKGLGNANERTPNIANQHYHYMLEQFLRVKNFQRANVDPDMRRQISRFTFREMSAVIDYSSRLSSQKGK